MICYTFRQAADADSVPHITYTLLSDNKSFNIDTTGAIRTARRFDNESDVKLYELVVTTVEGQNSLEPASRATARITCLVSKTETLKTKTILTFTILWVNSANDKLISFHISQENRI